MSVCILIGVLGGAWLDSRLGTSPWLLLLGSLLGAAAAFTVMYDLTVKGAIFRAVRRGGSVGGSDGRRSRAGGGQRGGANE
jgi:F0F1-type ATP synthase assembly protein I